MRSGAGWVQAGVTAEAAWMYQLELNLTVVVGFRSEAGGGARFSPGVGTATCPPGGTEITTYDPGPEDNPSEGRAARTARGASIRRSLVDQRPRRSEIHRLKALGEASIDRRQELARLFIPDLFAP